jgi:hypothetical protein
MYVVLIYIIIVFMFILFTKNVRKITEGQQLESYDYSEFQPILDDDILDEQLKEHLDKYSEDLDTILKNVIDKENIKKDITDELQSSDNKENLLYDIYVRDTLGELTQTEYDEETYNKYLKHYVEFNDTKKKSINIPYSNEQAKLFKKTYKPDVLYYNESDYVDKKYYENIKNTNKQDEISLPGLIDKSDGIVLNNIIEKESDKIIDITNAEFCCDYSALRIEEQPILSSEELNKVNDRMKHDNIEDIDLDEESSIYAYNYPYYEYMKGYNLIYDSLYLNYNKSRNIGSINL